MHYLSVCNRDAFKSFYCNALFLLFEKFFRCYEKCFHTAQKMKFSIKDSSVNMTKSTENCGCSHIYRRNL